MHTVRSHRRPTPLKTRLSLVLLAAAAALGAGLAALPTSVATPTDRAQTDRAQTDRAQTDRAQTDRDQTDRDQATGREPVSAAEGSKKSGSSAAPSTERSQDESDPSAAGPMSAAPTTAPTTSGWRPVPGKRWEWQLSSVPSTAQLDADADVAAFDIDAFDAPASTVSSIHARGKGAVAYISAGTWEDWRPDAAKFPASVKGSSNGWPGERWLDIRRLDVLGPIMKARMQMAKNKGFDAVEPDNVDGYSNRSGFRLTYDDQLRYNRWLADTAHSLGLKIALKNDVEQVPDLEPHFDWALNEEGFSYDEMSVYTSTFLAHGKAVWNVEYELPMSSFCQKAKAMGVDSMKKTDDLTAWRRSC